MQAAREVAMVLKDRVIQVTREAERQIAEAYRAGFVAGYLARVADEEEVVRQP